MIAASPESVRDAFLDACRAELSALKPGNVHVHAAGHGMTVDQFEASAEAAAPFIADPALRVGARIRHAVEASFTAAGCNTNLGIVLLCAPLAAAAGQSPIFDVRGSPPPSLPRKGGGTRPSEMHGNSSLIGRGSGGGRLDAVPPPLRGRLGGGEPRTDIVTHDDLRRPLSRILAALDGEDATDVFAAIARANPGGLGTVADQDVARPPTTTLKAAMALAAGRDRIARAYVTDFEDIFDLGLPALNEARARAADARFAVTTLHMTFLAAFPDSHIARKHGASVAAEVRRAAGDRRPLWHPAATPASSSALLAFDRDLKTRGLNPGTTADLVVATLFAEGLVSPPTNPPSERA